MATTLTDLRAALRSRVSLPADDPMVADADVDIDINAGLQAMASEYDWPWLQVEDAAMVTVAGARTVAPPAGWVRTLWIADFSIASELELRQRRDLIRYETVTGGGQNRPRLYAIGADVIVLAPTPNAVYTYTHAYIKQENVLSSGSDAMLAPDRYKGLIVAYAAIQTGTRLKDAFIVSAARADADGWIKRMKDNVRRTASTVRVKTRNDWSM